ncbi:WXG100 family type VII secretion target [Nocardioides sp. TRM66260-LWL]|uniref:WXG100 family type VII secretion target n=1 Tax=Nocardioides sp. TRM66260-LWL TaxID=2874478 RepID=UPI001CC7B89D|nr:WXG100 family type VII secretion target [Nocardioides sp. TRM66260-LWL]MBZ5736054.1 WXG100 family type VII secretion target [Nocardioides sp. TRM66260-LWL]
MTIDGIHVRHAGVAAGAADLARTVRRLEERLQRLEADLAPLRAGWDGEARSAYDAAKAAWDRAMDDLRALLAATGSAVATADAEYAAADRRGAGLFG